MNPHVFRRLSCFVFYSCLALLASGSLALGLEDCQRCKHCVEGRCVPNRQVYGHYQTAWRRWPVEAAAITPPGRKGARVDSQLGPGVEVPAPESEADVAPEFPHLKKKGGGSESSSGPAADAPRPPAAAETESTLPPATDLPKEETDPFQDDLGNTNSNDTGSPPAVDPQSNLNQGRTSRLGFGWSVGETDAVPASFTQEIPGGLATPLPPTMTGTAVQSAYPEVDAGNPLRFEEVAAPRNTLRANGTPTARGTTPTTVRPASAPVLPPPTMLNPLRRK